MEQNWERTFPFINIHRNEIEILFNGILDKSDIVNISSISEGCRTSNYIIEGKKHKYLLKIFFSYNQNNKKEFFLLNNLKEKINVQSVYRISNSKVIDNRQFGIYEYVEGVSLGKYLAEGNNINSDFIKNVARSLAKIHSHKFERAGFFDKNLNILEYVPPINEWYTMFLTNRVRERLGENLSKKILEAADKYSTQLENLDKDIRLVHGDFQGTNILISNDKPYILDWEFAMAGHPIADIGQFFRYDEYYSEDLIKDFEIEYKKCSDYILKDDWYRISKIRDIPNLLQLMDTDEQMPHKFNNIISILNNILKIVYYNSAKTLE